MVGEINVIYSENFRNYLDLLAQIFYKLGYFGFIEDVDVYFDILYDFIENSIDLPITRNSPKNFKKFGEKFLKYKANNRTTWYIFFDQKGNKFLVNHILNNHHQDFPELI